MNTPKRRILAGALALTLVAAACGSDEDTSSDTEAATAATDAPAATEAPDTTDEMT